MATLPLRWHGRARALRILDVLQQRTQAWSRDWLVGMPDCNVDLQLRENVEAADGGCWLRAPDRAGVTVRIPGVGLAAVGSVLAAVDETEAFADAIGRRGMADLLASWTNAAAVELQSLQGPVAGNTQSRHGVLGLVLTLGPLSIDLYLDSALCNSLAAPQASPRANLCNRREALMGSTIRLRATIDLGYAGVDAAATLRPGEIIRTAAIPDSVVSVCADSGTVLFRGVLGSIEGHKALRCTSVEQQTGRK